MERTRLRNGCLVEEYFLSRKVRDTVGLHFLFYFVRKSGDLPLNGGKSFFVFGVD